MQNSSVRKPVVAGQFYPSAKDDLLKQIENLTRKNVDRLEVTACILPHAGYTYSGAVVGETVSRIQLKEKVILLGPNHTGYGAQFSIMTEGKWQTPLGTLSIDSHLANYLVTHSRYLEVDARAHAQEHSLEVELPFLQYTKDTFQIVPIVFMSEELQVLQEIGREIARSLKELHLEKSTLIVASTDFTHYEPQGQAQKKDSMAIEATRT